MSEGVFYEKFLMPPYLLPSQWEAYHLQLRGGWSLKESLQQLPLWPTPPLHSHFEKEKVSTAAQINNWIYVICW